MRVVASIAIGSLALIAFAIALAPVAALDRRAPAPAHALDPQSAIVGSLAYLERDGFAWMRGEVPIQSGSGCVSCHHVAFALWTEREARERGIVRDGSRIDELAGEAIAFQRDRGEVVPVGQLLLARASLERRERVDDLTRNWLATLGERQGECGHWEAGGQFPTQKRSIEESDAVASYWTLLAIDAYHGNFEHDCADAAASVEAVRPRAYAWMDDERSGGTVEWFTARMLVEHEMGDPAEAAALRRELLAAQNPDGGWPWIAGEPSQAFSTGQVLYALGRSGGEAHAVQRGVDYLLTTRRADGTWDVPSRLTSADPSRGKDYIYRYWGTAWATLGLVRSIESPPAVRTVSGAMQ